MTTDAENPVELLARTIEVVAIDSIAPHPDNTNEGEAEAVGESVDEVGFYQIIGVQRSSGLIIFGETRWNTLRAKGSRIAPVVFYDVDDATAERMRVGDNEIARRHSRIREPALAAALARLKKTDAGLRGTGYDDAGLRALVRGLQITPDESANVIPARPEARTTRGDLWLLGEHRLLCGDAFADDDVDRLLADLAAALVLTDPPYAVYGSATGIASDIADDKMVRPFFAALGKMIWRILPEFGHAYVHCDWRSYATLWEGFKAAGLSPKNCLVWDKGGAGLGANYANTHEFVAFWSRLAPETAMTASRKRGQRTVAASNILRYPRPTGDDRQHNAAKPVEMLAALIGNSSDPGDVVVDLFGGSGSTLMAAEDTGRTAAVMEIEPGMCDVILARWEAATGRQAVCAHTP